MTDTEVTTVGLLPTRDALRRIERRMRKMQTPTQNRDKEERRSKLYEAATKGDWNTANKIFEKYPEGKTERLNIRGETPLHVAVAARRIDFALKLVAMLEDKDLEIRTISKKHMLKSDEEGSVGSSSDTKRGNTAFGYAAIYGFLECIQFMIQKNPCLIDMRDGDGRLPVCTASLNGHWVTAYSLYEMVGHRMEDLDLFQLAINLIKIERYGFGKKLMETVEVES